MIAAVFALVASLAIVLGGNASQLLGALAKRSASPNALVMSAAAGQVAIALLTLVAGYSLAPALDHAWARALAAASLAVAIIFVMKPARLILPSEPTHSLGALGLVAAAFSIRDGIAPLGLAMGLVTTDLPGVALALAMGISVSSILAARGGSPIFGANARYLASAIMASGAFYIGAFAV